MIVFNCALCIVILKYLLLQINYILLQLINKSIVYWFQCVVFFSSINYTQLLQALQFVSYILEFESLARNQSHDAFSEED